MSLVGHRLRRRAWRPIALANLVLWVRSDSRVTSPGGAVSQWDDLSGSGNDLAQGTADNQPDDNTVTLNSKPAIHFDGNDVLDVTLGESLTQPLTIYVVGSMDATGANETFVGGTDADQVVLRGGATGPRWELRAGMQIFGGTADTGWHSFVGLVDGASSELWLDGSSIASGDAGSNGFGAGIRLGAINTGGSALTGDIAEVAIQDGTGTATERAKWDSYVSWRWGVS